MNAVLERLHAQQILTVTIHQAAIHVSVILDMNTVGVPVEASTIKLYFN